MRDWQKETEKRVEFIKNILEEAHAGGVVFGNSGGKDSALAGILSKLATKNVLSVIMPCASSVNYNQDKTDARKLCEKFGIESMEVDLTAARAILMENISKALPVGASAAINIAPRLRMTALYTIAQTKNYLVAGTGNASEHYMGYFTKWGDGAYDFNAIGDLTASEVFDFLRYLGAPDSIIEKAPSAGLFEGQTDEAEMGVTYADIDEYIRSAKTNARAKEIIDRFHSRSAHKRRPPKIFGGD